VIRLFFAEGCPYAQRTWALLKRLGVPYEAITVDLLNKSVEFLALSPTGAVPLIQDDELVLFESAVINEYLAEKFAWSAAFSGDVKQRARERLAMKRFDELLVPVFFQRLKDASVLEAKPSWRREVALLGETVKQSVPGSLIGLHVATHWLRMGWLAPKSPMVVAIRESAGAFFEAASTLPEIVSTTPDADATVRAIKAKFGV
jgi:glutaredoxin